MRIRRELAVVAVGLGITAVQASACKCGGVNGRTEWEIAERKAQSRHAIFEATPEQFAVQWNVLNARPGELVPIDLESHWTSRCSPYLLVTFRVTRVYKGAVGSRVQVRTGMGGGDCGAEFATGLEYLVYADGPGVGELHVSMCSPGGWLGSNAVSTELRYLRRERPTRRDLANVDYWSPPAVARRDREREEFRRSYAAVTGQICGAVTPPPGDGRLQTVAFLSTAGYSPYGGHTADVDRSGRFCSERLGPGDYYLSFARRNQDCELESASYYPGVIERGKASTVRVDAGRVTAGVTFRVPEQPRHTVRGFLSTNDQTKLGRDGGAVMLVSPDGNVRYRQEVDFRMSFPLPKTKYFSFGNVLPGRYLAFASGPGSDWLTKVVEVNVTTHSKLVFLTLERHAKGIQK